MGMPYPARTRIESRRSRFFRWHTRARSSADDCGCTGTLHQLPFHLQARGEFEEVGRKPLGDGFVSVPVREFRGALVRGFQGGKIQVGVHFQIARGYTGQTTGVLALPAEGEPFERVVASTFSHPDLQGQHA
jgi:hypothetical protein